MSRLPHVFALAAVLALPLVALDASAQVGPEVTITIGPPDAKAETPTASPGEGYVWLRGEWVWSPVRTAYVWHPGHWAPHPMGRELWYPGKWTFFQSGWRYAPGFWRSAKEPAPPAEAIKLAAVALQPPELKVENVPQKVSPSFGWTGGHWAYTGTEFRWVPGHWAYIPSGFHEWVGGHWYRSGEYWFFASGYWR